MTEKKEKVWTSNHENRNLLKCAFVHDKMESNVNDFIIHDTKHTECVELNHDEFIKVLSRVWITNSLVSVEVRSLKMFVYVACCSTTLLRRNFIILKSKY